MNYFSNHPRTLWVIDGVGALVSAISLGLILPSIQNWIGMPTQTLYILAIFPVFFALYDAFNLRQPISTWPQRLKWIAVANASYCLLSMVMMAIHFPLLTIWGMTYFVGECLIVATLAGIEWKTAKRLIR